MKRRAFIKNTAILGAAAMSSAILSDSGHADEKGPVQTLKDPANPTTLEKKHVPLIEAPGNVKKGEWFDVRVKVGYMIEHPSTTGHWIDEIELLVNGKKITELENEVGGVTSPNGLFRIRLQETSEIRAVIDCNLHGKWTGSSVKVTVT